MGRAGGWIQSPGRRQGATLGPMPTLAILLITSLSTASAASPTLPGRGASLTVCEADPAAACWAEATRFTRFATPPGIFRAPVEVDALLDHLRTRLAGYEIPTDVAVVEEIPRTPSGKADLTAVRGHFTSVEHA